MDIDGEEDENNQTLAIGGDDEDMMQDMQDMIFGASTASEKAN